MNEVETLINEKVLNLKSLSGGCIGKSYKIETSNNIYFVKKYSRRGVSSAEALGLIEIEKSETIKVPRVIKYSENLIVLDFIEEGYKSKDFYTLLGKELASLHKKSQGEYGFSCNNFIGETPQLNDLNRNWISFYTENRLAFQINLAKENGYNLVTKFQKLKKLIPEILQDSIEEPSLIHGDLWGGNIMADTDGNPVIFDPAVYYGHREAELAMTRLFGGFTKEFYDSYNGTYPLKERWQERENLYKLYHILNHLNLFGSSYYHQAVSIIDYYTK